MLSGKSGRIGAVLCRAYEIGLGDHITIKGHDGPTSDILSLSYIPILLNSYQLVSGTVHLGSVLCRDYENGLGDNMAIEDEDGPNRVLFL